nr:MAG TPA: hypothetical protein [Caudoviricetes sp.]
MSRTATIYKGWEIYRGAATNEFKHGQIFKPLRNEGKWLEINNLSDEDYAFGSVIIHDEQDKYGHKIYAQAYVWDLHKEFEMINMEAQKVEDGK